MEITIETRLTKDEFVTALINANKKNLKIILISSIIIYLAAIITLALNIITKDNDYIDAIIFFICATIFLILFFLLKSKKFMEKSILKNNKSFDEGAYYKYTFKDDCLVVDFLANQASGNQVIYYNNLFKEFVVGNILYIYINRINCYIVKLDGLTDDEKNQIFNIFPKKVKGI